MRSTRPLVGFHLAARKFPRGGVHPGTIGGESIDTTSMQVNLLYGESGIMEEALSIVGVIVLGVPAYLSGLLLWPAYAILWRKRNWRARVLRWVSFSHLALLVVLIGFSLFSRGLLEHQYYWFAMMILLNLLFTPFAFAAANFDARRNALLLSRAQKAD